MRESLWWLRIVLGMVIGGAAVWLAMWGLVLLSNVVPVVLVFVGFVVAIGLIESRRQKRAEDLVGNVEAFLGWERVQLMMERLREARARRRLEELRRAGRLPSE